MFTQLKRSIRNLWRGGVYSLINIAGLAISLTAVLLIMLWVSDEMSYDTFHKRSRDIYVAAISIDWRGEQYNWSVLPAPMAGVGKTEIPEIENACRILDSWSVEYLKKDDNVLTDVRCAMVDSSFFSIFNFEVKEGDVRNWLQDYQSVILSESAANALFGGENPMGKVIIDNAKREFHVTGVIADMPQNSTNRYDVLFAFSLYESMDPLVNERWDQFNYKTYYLLNPGVDALLVAQKLSQLLQKNINMEVTCSCSLHALVKENLYHQDGTPNTKLQTCRLFSAVTGVLLLIACINYVNLVTSRASRRNREIFVRCVMGARKRNLFAHFLNESLLLFLCSMILATFLVYAFFPLFNQISGKSLNFQLFSSATLLVYGLAFVVTMLFAGIYPAYRLSLGANVTKVSVSSVLLKRALVVLQFSASVALIFAAVTTNRQIHFIKTMDPGYNREQLFYVPLSGDMRWRQSEIKSRLSNLPGIKGVTFTSQNLSQVREFTGGVEWEGMEANSQVTFIVLRTDKDFIPLMDIQLAEGSNFTGMPLDSACYLVNRMAVSAMGMQEPIGKGINDGTIIGVVEDFHFQSLHEPIKPLLITINVRSNFMYVKAGVNSASEAVLAVESLYKSYNSEIPFTYHFVDEEFDRIYKTDIRTGVLFNFFSLIAILVSCLGLFGLVTYTVETKTKEIGIRKVMGASLSGIVEMVSKEFLLLVGIAMLIAFPLAYYWSGRMLQDYAYRIAIGWWMFVLAGGITVALTLITVGWQAVRAATANPVEAIMSE